MNNKYNNMEELNNIAPVVAKVGNRSPYFVPSAYFDSLAASIVHFVKLSEIREAKTYSIPVDYFETLADSIINKVRVAESGEIYEELSQLAPLLTTITRENVFSVPGDYFEKLSMPVLDAPISKVVPFNKNLKKWVTYAVAASVLFIVVITGYLYVSDHTLDGESLSVEQKLTQLRDQDIINYLKDNEEITSGTIIPVSVEEDTEIQNMLRNASDEEIQKYLDEYSDPTEKTAKGI